jgi:hypothetical protein
MNRFPLSLPLALGLPLLFTACATIAPPQPPSLDLPKPPSDLRASRKGDRVILTWTIPSATTDRQAVRTLGATQICRSPSAELTQCGTPVGRAATTLRTATSESSKQKPNGSYTDTLPPQIESDAASAFVTYAVAVLNREGRSAGLSNQVRLSLIRTLPPPQDFEAHVTGQGIALSWTGEIPPGRPDVHYLYRVYRRQKDQPQTVVGDILAGDEHHFTLTDSDIEWGKTYEYHAETETVIAEASKPEMRVEGDDTPVVRVFADDVFPPAVPAGLQAVFSGPGQQPFIDLVWAPVSDVDLAGYNVYRYTEGTSALKLNAGLVRAPAYRDASVEAGKRYLYSVTAVDLRGNESAQSEEASEKVP